MSSLATSPAVSPTSITRSAPEAPAVVTPISPPSAATSPHGAPVGAITLNTSPHGSATTSANMASVALAIYQGGHIDGVERNLGAMRKFLGQCTSPHTAHLTSFPAMSPSSAASSSAPHSSLPPLHPPTLSPSSSFISLSPTPEHSPLGAAASSSTPVHVRIPSSGASTLSVPSLSPHASPTHARTPSRSHVRSPSRVSLEAITSMLFEPTSAVATATTDTRPDIAVFPELFLTGYVGGEERVVAHAQWIDGPALRLISSMAKEFKIAIVFGYPERQGTKVYNSVMMIGRDGAQLLNYRKTHLYGEYESKLFTAGPTLPPVIDYLGVKISLLICYDIEYVEPARCLALAGCELLIVVTANTNQRNNLITIPARAMDNLIHVAYVNRAVTEACPSLGKDLAFNGDSVVAAPDGSLLLQLPHAKQGWGIVRVTPHSPQWTSSYESNLGLYTGRRPDLYRAIIDAPVKLSPLLAELPPRAPPSPAIPHPTMSLHTLPRPEHEAMLTT